MEKKWTIGKNDIVCAYQSSHKCCICYKFHRLIGPLSGSKYFW